MSANVKGFRRRPLTGDAANPGGRRPKPSKGTSRNFSDVRSHVGNRGISGRVLLKLSCSPFVKGFRCRPLTGDAANSGGRRPKPSKGGNREKECAEGAGY